MCVEAMFIDDVPCAVAPNCPDYLRHLQQKNNVTVNYVGETISERNIRHIQCPINAIKIRRRATILLKTLYFPDALSQLAKYQETKFDDGLTYISGQKVNFTATLSISHEDNMKDLYYQQSECTSDTNVPVEFLAGGRLGADKTTVPMWIYAAAVAGALLLLLLIILILIRLGFFKRQDELEEEEEEEDDDDEEY